MKNIMCVLLLFFLFITLPDDLIAQEKREQADKIYVDMGYQSGIGDFATDYFNAQITYGKEANSKLFYGLGGTFRTNQLIDQKIAGAFLNTKSRLVSSYKPLLIDIGVGYNFELGEEFKEGGVLFMAGLHNEFSIKKNFNFYCAVNYDVMRMKRFGEFYLYRSYNVRVGLSF